MTCAQPASRAQLDAAVVHLVLSEHRGAAESGKAPGLAAGYEVGLCGAGGWMAAAVLEGGEANSDKLESMGRPE